MSSSTSASASSATVTSSSAVRQNSQPHAHAHAERQRAFTTPFPRGLSFYSSRTPTSVKALPDNKPQTLQRDVSYDHDLPHIVKRLDQQEAEAIEQELTQVYGFTIEQQIELLGLAAAHAFSTAYPKDSLKKAHGAFLVCCGPGMNGATGLVCARHLKMFGYRPSIYCVKSPSKKLVKTLVSQCEKLEMPFLGYLPSEKQLINDGYNAIVDSVFGFRFKPPLRPEYEDVINMMKRIKIPVMSIDVPSGWDVANGDPEGLQPDCLVSLIAPKKCARYFKGRLHFIGGRFIPRLLAQKFDLSLPHFPGTEQCVEIAVLNAMVSEDCDKNSSSPSSANDKFNAKEQNESVWGASD